MNQVNSDNTAIVTQLKEQISQLNKRLMIKEKELQTKDQQVSAAYDVWSIFVAKSLMLTLTNIPFNICVRV